LMIFILFFVFFWWLFYSSSLLLFTHSVTNHTITHILWYIGSLVSIVFYVCVCVCVCLDQFFDNNNSFWYLYNWIGIGNCFTIFLDIDEISCWYLLFFFLTSLSSSFNDIIEIHFSQWILKPPTCTHSFIHSYIRFIIHCICCWIVYLYLSINDWIMKKKRY
jgi:hypothetical protein